MQTQTLPGIDAGGEGDDQNLSNVDIVEQTGLTTVNYKSQDVTQDRIQPDGRTRKPRKTGKQVRQSQIPNRATIELASDYEH